MSLCRGIPLKTRQELDEAIQRIDADDALRAGFGDARLNRYAHERWGNQTVQQVDGEVFDQINSRVMVRGITKLEYVDDNLKGVLHGEGTYGNGQYFAAGNDWKTGVTYASPDSGGHALVAKLDPRARVISSDQLDRLSARTPTANRSFFYDKGRIAADEGYDAIEVGSPDYIVVLNNPGGDSR